MAVVWECCYSWRDRDWIDDDDEYAGPGYDIRDNIIDVYCFVFCFCGASTEMTRSASECFSLDFTHTAARKYGARVLARETNRGGRSRTDDRQTNR